MKQSKIPKAGSRNSEGFSTMERRRLISLSIGTLVVGGAIIIGMLKSSTEPKRDPLLGPEGEFTETVVAPTIDTAALEALVQDTAADERVVLEGDAVSYLVGETRNLTPGQFHAMGIRDLSNEEHGELLAQATGKRGQPYTIRGWVDDQRTRQRGDGQEHVVRLRLEELGSEQQRYAYFVSRDVPMPLIEDDYLRMDGIFLKIFSDESAVTSGTWLEGPLLVGRSAERSVPAFGPVTELDNEIFMGVRDDVLVGPDGAVSNPSQSIPFTPVWNLMAYARDLPEGAVNWEEAPLLKRMELQAISDSGGSFRLEPYRIPLSLLQDVSVHMADENPARITRYTEGWIGNKGWKNVVRFRGPFETDEAVRQDYIVARGFFLKNFSYISAEKGIRTAPFFVLHSMEIMHPEPDAIYATITKGVVIGALLFMLGFVVLVRLNTKHRDGLQADLLRRRQERRKKRAFQGQAT